MDVLLLSLFSCSFLCDLLYLCITVYVHLAAALLSTSGSGSLSTRLSGLGIVYVVLIRVVLWAVVSEWMRTWKVDYSNVNHLEKKKLLYGDKYIVGIFDILSFLPICRSGFSE